jgi:hypothetical protein
MQKNRKISIGSNIIQGPWGGGNQFADSLTKYLISRDWAVVNDLKEPDIDIILMTEPRRSSATSKFNQLHIAWYCLKRPGTIVVHRINECDERKKTNYVNNYLSRASRVSDFTVFISKFLMDLFTAQGYFSNKRIGYIRNGADEKIYNSKEKKYWDGKSIIKIVTHHWAYNYYKGFDVYHKLDILKKINGFDIQFTYIGRIHETEKFENADIIEPLYGVDLAQELKKHHIYITGSLNEPAGMHHIEGAMCGLPLLYRNSGALPEYCNGFGVMFENKDDVEVNLSILIKNYNDYVAELKNYPYSAEFMCRNYEELFNNLLEKKDDTNYLYRRIKFLGIFLYEVFKQCFEILFLKIIKIKKIKKVFYGKRTF